MMYILDTDVLSELARNSGHGALKAWVRDQPNHSLMITFSVFLEIHRGIERLRDSNPSKACQLEEWFERLVASDQFVIADLNVWSAKIYAKMTLMPALRGFWTTNAKSKDPQMGQDLAIAAMAIFHNLPIVTRNHKDFLRIHSYFPLPGVFNPVHDKWYVPTTEDSESGDIIAFF